jgi:hypothetical protein
VQAPTVSEDEDSADLIVPDGEGGASVGDKWVLPDKEIICYARQYPEGPVDSPMHMLSYQLLCHPSLSSWTSRLQVYDIMHDIMVQNLWYCLWYHRSMIS